MTEKRIKILKDGPYLVSGDIDLSEKMILPENDDAKDAKYIWEDAGSIDHDKTYALCRCGASKKHPFCDGSHGDINFDGTETACREPYRDRAELIRGNNVDLLDDGRCAGARFCYRKTGDAWYLATCEDNSEKTVFEAVKSASECPAGRLTAIARDGSCIEPELDQAIEITQDPENDVSGGIYVKGGIPLVSADGSEYETRNRIVLCRCGKSKNKPFCDGAHVDVNFKDKGSIKS
ncbi:MAG: CDGSH iron-sulfur domain-containing protein [Synergistaceae bacterium]|nr:CDGSH iron-sulfur domain-containing protein [Synergistaceae bacterium]